MRRRLAGRARAGLPEWIPPQLTQLFDTGAGRRGMAARNQYPPIAVAVASPTARQAYLDGELCGFFPTALPPSA
jgi:hypothetical protein